MEKPKRAATGRDSEKYIVRFPEGMREKIAAAAKEGNRSMNAEIIGRLEKSFTNQVTINELVSSLQSILPSLERQEKQIAAQQNLVKAFANFIAEVATLITPASEEQKELLEYVGRIAFLIGSDNAPEGIRSAMALMEVRGEIFNRLARRSTEGEHAEIRSSSEEIGKKFHEEDSISKDDERQ